MKSQKPKKAKPKPSSKSGSKPARTKAAAKTPAKKPAKPKAAAKKPAAKAKAAKPAKKKLAALKAASRKKTALRKPAPKPARGGARKAKALPPSIASLKVEVSTVAPRPSRPPKPPKVQKAPVPRPAPARKTTAMRLPPEAFRKNWSRGPQLRGWADRYNAAGRPQKTAEWRAGKMRKVH